MNIFFFQQNYLFREYIYLLQCNPNTSRILLDICFDLQYNEKKKKNRKIPVPQTALKPK